MGRRAGHDHPQPIERRHRIAKNLFGRSGTRAITASDHRQKRNERDSGEAKGGEGDIEQMPSANEREHHRSDRREQRLSGQE